MLSARHNRENYRDCACKWSDECKRLREIFASNDVNDDGDVRGKECVKLDLSGTSEKMRIWKVAVIANLKIEDNADVNRKKVPVARHHWSLGQLECLFDDVNHNPSTPLPFSDLKK